MASLQIYCHDKNNHVFNYDCGRLNGFAWNYFIWRIVSEKLGIDFSKTFHSFRTDEKTQHAQKRVWGATHDKTLPFYMRVCLALSLDMPYFKMKRINSVIDCLRKFWENHGETNLARTVPEVAQHLLNIRDNEELKLKGIFITPNDEYFDTPEIYEDLEPKEDEHSRTLVTVKKYLTYNDVKLNRERNGRTIHTTEWLWQEQN